MIKASELRIGNLLSFKGKIMKVSGIEPTNKGIYLEGDDGKFALEGPATIPLTPEWLKRCGMELRKDDKVWQIQVGNTSYLEIEAEDPFMAGVTPETWRDLCPVYIWGDVKYVHQLQNLYFALTGEELEIKN
jgi:hypothetical protein